MRRKRRQIQLKTINLNYEKEERNLKRGTPEIRQGNRVLFEVDSTESVQGSVREASIEAEAIEGWVSFAKV